MSGFVPDEVGSSFGLQLGEASPISDWEDLEEEEVGEGPGGAFELSCNVCSFQPKFTVRACPVSLVSEEGVSLFSSDTVLPALDIQESRRHKITTCECLISHTPRAAGAKVWSVTKLLKPAKNVWLAITMVITLCLVAQRSMSRIVWASHPCSG